MHWPRDIDSELLLVTNQNHWLFTGPGLHKTTARKQPAIDQDYWSLIGPISPQNQHGEPGWTANKAIRIRVLEAEFMLKYRQLVIGKQICWHYKFINFVKLWVRCQSFFFDCVVFFVRMKTSSTNQTKVARKKQILAANCSDDLFAEGLIVHMFACVCSWAHCDSMYWHLGSPGTQILISPLQLCVSHSQKKKLSKPPKTPFN